MLTTVDENGGRKKLFISFNFTLVSFIINYLIKFLKFISFFRKNVKFLITMLLKFLYYLQINKTTIFDFLKERKLSARLFQILII